jgi:hypothetical protein
LFTIIVLSHNGVKEVIKAPSAALVAGVQGTFHVTALVLFVAAALVGWLWHIERKRSHNL